MTQRIRSGITDISIKSFEQWLVEEYAKYSDKKLNTAFVRNVSDLRSFRATTGKQRPSDSRLVEGSRDKDSVAFPRMHLTIGSLSLHSDKAGYKKKHAFGGLQIGRDTFAGEAYFESARPVILELGATFFADSIDDIFCYATMLFEVAPRIAMYIADDETGFNFEIGVGIEGDLTIPQADMSTPGDPFAMETVFRLHTYTGVASKQRLIRRITVTAQPNASPGTRFTIDDLQRDMEKLFDMRYYDVYNRDSVYYRGDYKELNK